MHCAVGNDRCGPIAFNSRGGSGWCSGVTWTHGTWRHAEVRFLHPGVLVARMPAASARETERQQDGSEHRNRQMILAGLEPAIPGSVGRCLIHWATGPDICVVHLMLQARDPNSPPQHESKSRGSDVTCFGPIALQFAARCRMHAAMAAAARRKRPRTDLKRNRRVQSPEC